MSDIELVIKIDDQTYNNFVHNEYSRADVMAIHAALVNSTPLKNDKWVCPFNYFPKVGIIFKKTLKEVHKSKILCPMCEYRDSSFMPCNACDDLGSQFKKSEEI